MQVIPGHQFLGDRPIGYNYDLLGGLEHEWVIFQLQYIGNVILPIDELHPFYIFQDDYCTTNQMNYDD